MKFQHAAQQRMRGNEIGPVMIETEAVRAFTFFNAESLKPTTAIGWADVLSRHPPNESVTGYAWSGLCTCSSGGLFQAPKKPRLLGKST
jgi:hypothetical protein